MIEKSAIAFIRSSDSINIEINGTSTISIIYTIWCCRQGWHTFRFNEDILVNYFVNQDYLDALQPSSQGRFSLSEIIFHNSFFKSKHSNTNVSMILPKPSRSKVLIGLKLYQNSIPHRQSSKPINIKFIMTMFAFRKWDHFGFILYK